jgi:hypothetical protein
MLDCRSMNALNFITMHREMYVFKPYTLSAPTKWALIKTKYDVMTTTHHGHHVRTSKGNKSPQVTKVGNIGRLVTKLHWSSIFYKNMNLLGKTHGNKSRTHLSAKICMFWWPRIKEHAAQSLDCFSCPRSKLNYKHIPYQDRNEMSSFYKDTARICKPIIGKLFWQLL